MHKPAKVKAACDNCGFVAIYDIPYRAKFISFCDDEATSKASFFKPMFPFTRERVDCVNCGLPKLEVIYWDVTGKSPLHSIDKVHEYRPTDDLA